MAKRRMLSVNIRYSKKLARLKSDFSRLCWTWIIPFTDDFGRFEADPEVFRATCFPLIKSATAKKVTDSLSELAAVGLIQTYRSGDSIYGEIVDFDRFQTFKSDRTRKAEYPIPEQGDYISGIQWNPMESTTDTRELKRTELKGTEEKGTVPTKTAYAEFVHLTEKQHSTLVEKHGAEKTERIIEKLNNAKGSKGYTYTSDYHAISSWVLDAVNENSSTNGKRETNTDRAMAEVHRLAEEERAGK